MWNKQGVISNAKCNTTRILIKALLLTRLLKYIAHSLRPSHNFTLNTSPPLSIATKHTPRPNNPNTTTKIINSH